MACNTITDGTGKGYVAAVNSDNRLETRSVTRPVVSDISHENGEAFVVASDFITLTTTASFNGILYIKNTSTTKHLHIEKIRVCSSASGSVQCRLVKNPTTGTLISDANSADVGNANFSSALAFTGLGYAASGDGKTITDGTNFSNFINNSPGHSIQEYLGALILGPGDSLALTAKPSASTTLCSEIQCYFEVI